MRVLVALWTAVVGALLFNLAPTAFAQDTLWTRTYGGVDRDVCNCVRQTVDGGYVLAGLTDDYYGPFDAQYYLVKVDQFGDTLWSRKYGGDSYEEAHCVDVTSDGGYILAGDTYSYGAGHADFYLVKTDALGDTLWTSVHGSPGFDKARSVQQTTDGGYIVGGWISPEGLNPDVYLVKTDEYGDVVWTRTYGGSANDYGRSVRQTTDGGYVIAGGTYSFGAGGWDVYLVKTDSSGDTLWTRTYDGDNRDGARSVEQTADGGYILAGYANYVFNPPYEHYSDLFLVKTDSNGTAEWSRMFSWGQEQRGHSVLQSGDGGYVVAGYFIAEMFGAVHFYVMKTDDRGTPMWVRTYGGDGSGAANSIVESADGGYAAGGGAYSFGAGRGDAYLVRIDESGTPVEERVFDTPARFSLSQNYPNPFNIRTSMQFHLPQAASVLLEVYNVLGERVVTLMNERQQPGFKSLSWDASDVSSGLYFYKLTAGDFTETKRMMLVK